MFHGVDPGSEDGALAGVVNRNIKALIEFRREIEQRRSFQDRFADAVTRFAGSMPFVYLHAGLLGFWLAANSGIFPHLKPWDPFPFVMLAMIASVEAIFLTTFVLVSNNRQAAIQARQSDLDLQISLLAEHEITRLIALAEAIAKRLNVHAEGEEELDELKKDVEPEAVLSQLQAVEELENEDKPHPRSA